MTSTGTGLVKGKGNTMSTTRPGFRPVSPTVRWENCMGCGRSYGGELDWLMSTEVEIGSLGVQAELLCPDCQK
jgi:hypothetical protein